MVVHCRKPISESRSFAKIARGIGHFFLCAARHRTTRIHPFIAYDYDGGDDHLRLTVTATPASESTRGAMKSPVRQCGLLLMAFTVCAEPALAAGSYLNCQTKKATIIDAPNGKSSLSTEENVGFWIDEAAKTITLEDGTPLIVRRFDDRWISAARGDESYEIDRQDGNLAYASSTTKDGVTTIIIGYGRCKLAAGPAG
jgi:hypothetical protein